MSNIIERLNALQTLTPDEIVAKLKFKGWILGRDMTKAQYDKLNSRPRDVFLCTVRGYGDEADWGPTGYSMMWSFESVRTDLKDYFFISKEDYDRGPCKPDRPS